MGGNPMIFHRAKYIEKILKKYKFWHYQLRKILRKYKNINIDTSNWESFLIDPLATNNAMRCDSLTINVACYARERYIDKYLGDFKGGFKII